MMEMFGHCILREVVSDIQKNRCFVIIVEGTQDGVSGREQESICLRHVNYDLHVHQDFVGLYEIPSTTSESIAGMVFDVLTRFASPLSNLRAQIRWSSNHECPLHWLPGKSKTISAFSALFSLCIAYCKLRDAKCRNILSIGSKRLTVDK